ncbi:hypothetical protein [Cellulosimicrobium funkei]|uniref:hypothetical protein n=1 Tax=Cellulosimicrobium funkei TaxID=264251 RepID=UPI0034272005
MRIELTVTEAVEIARATGGLPPYVRSVASEGDDVRVVVDLREVPDPPSALRLATRLVPFVRATLRVESVVAGTAVLAVEASAAGLPAHKLLGFVEGALQGALRSHGLPPEAVRVLPEARVAVDVQALLGRVLEHTFPGFQLTELAWADGSLRLDGRL